MRCAIRIVSLLPSATETVYALDGTVTSRHGMREVEVVEALANAFHPERCGEWAAPTLVQRVAALPSAAQAVRGGSLPPAPV